MIESSPFFASYAAGGALVANVDLVGAGGKPCRSIRVGQAGDLKVKRARDNAEVLISSVTAGETLELQASELVASGTTAQKITVFW